MNKTIYVTSTAKLLLRFSLIDKEIRVSVYEYIIPNTGRYMGLAKRDNYLYVGSNNKIYKFDTEDELKDKRFIYFDVSDPSLHHMSIIGDSLFVSSAHHNIVYETDLDLKYKNSYVINSDQHMHKNHHVNGIIEHDNKYYVTLNQFYRKYGMSGIAVFDKDFNELDRFEYGWHLHGFQIVDNRYYGLCNELKNEKGKFHPPQSGLMVDGELVFEYEKNRFCKDLSIDNDFIVIAGGETTKRENRKHTSGILFILDRDFKLLKKIEVKDSGEFAGCLIW